MSFFSQIMENAEINNIIKILGLQYKQNYSDPVSLKSLRYGKIMIMTDQVFALFNFASICTFLNIPHIYATLLQPISAFIVASVPKM